MHIYDPQSQEACLPFIPCETQKFPSLNQNQILTNTNVTGCLTMDFRLPEL